MRIKELIKDLTDQLNNLTASEKGTLQFNLDSQEGREAFNRASKSLDMALTLWDIGQEVFRPARKHGYAEGGVMNIYEWSEQTSEVVSKLEDKFYELLERRGINLDELVS